MKKSLIAALLAAALLFVPNASQAAEKEAAGATIVHLSHYSDDLHAAFMALKLANAVQSRGEAVVIFVDLEGVGLADGRRPNDLRWGQSKPLSEYFDAFVAAGGSVLVCPHCAKAAGLTAADLRKGARIASEDEVAAAMATAPRILDY